MGNRKDLSDFDKRLIVMDLGKITRSLKETLGPGINVAASVM